MVMTSVSTTLAAADHIQSCQSGTCHPYDTPALRGRLLGPPGGSAWCAPVSLEPSHHTHDLSHLSHQHPARHAPCCCTDLSVARRDRGGAVLGGGVGHLEDVGHLGVDQPLGHVSEGELGVCRPHESGGRKGHKDVRGKVVSVSEMHPGLVGRDEGQCGSSVPSS